MPHVVLIGDSIIDNAAYVSGGPCVTEQLRARLPRDWQVTMLAQDGAVVLDALEQLERLPGDATHVVLSAGGNDALVNSHIVNSPLGQPAQMLAELATVQQTFRDNYRQLTAAIRAARAVAIGLTVYDAIPSLSKIDQMALSVFNDVIVRELASAGMAILELRSVCNEPRDFSSVSPIEPSEQGGAKITQKLQTILLTHDFSRATTVFV